MMITTCDVKTLKYNNLSNLTGMIWQIDPATKILETNKFWKLAFTIIEISNHENDKFAYLKVPQVLQEPRLWLLGALAPWPPKSHEKHQLLLYVLSNIQYSAFGNILNRHENLHFLLC